VIESATEEATGEAEGEATSEAEATTEAPAPAPIPEDMVQIPAGPFTMGQDGSKPKNGPAHEVDVPAFEIDRFEVTNDEFARFVEEAGYQTYAEQNSSKNWKDVAEGKGNHPVVYVTWDDATAYCEWTGKRLPTEAEWEKAARGEDGRVYPWGSDFVAENGNFYEGGIRGTTAVGSFAAGASPYGVEDMAGNVREWTADDFVAYPGAAADADPFFGTENKVNRGGGWFDGEDGELVTTYNRNAGPPGTSANDDIGFRCARDGQ
jgi:formylglycine-generating enzyme required for sulfatase activity